MTESFYDQLAVRIYADRAALGLAAARGAAAIISEAIRRRNVARVIFACAPSQDEFLAALISPELSGAAFDWRQVVAFHMDEYVGLPRDAPASFRNYLHRHLLSLVSAPPRFHPIAGETAALPAECRRYAHLLKEAPIDLVCLGIGENGHLAFNDPPVADFDDLEVMKVVALDAGCRQQQVNDGCFAKIADVPQQALTLTVPALLNADHILAVVPGVRKANAVRAALRGPINSTCPASILRTHPQAVLHLDPESASLLPS